jgi:hypothetical protein
MMGSSLRAQALVDARSLALGGSPGAVRDTRGFAANPAGLVQMRDWDMSVSTYAEPLNSKSGFVFQACARNGYPISKLVADGKRSLPSFCSKSVFLSPPTEIEYRNRSVWHRAQILECAFGENRHTKPPNRGRCSIGSSCGIPFVSNGYAETYTRIAWLAMPAAVAAIDQWSLTITGRNMLRMFSVTRPCSVYRPGVTLGKAGCDTVRRAFTCWHRAARPEWAHWAPNGRRVSG